MEAELPAVAVSDAALEEEVVVVEVLLEAELAAAAAALLFCMACSADCATAAAAFTESDCVMPCNIIKQINDNKNTNHSHLIIPIKISFGNPHIVHVAAAAFSLHEGCVLLTCCCV